MMLSDCKAHLFKKSENIFVTCNMCNVQHSVQQSVQHIVKSCQELSSLSKVVKSCHKLS